MGVGGCGKGIWPGAAPLPSPPFSPWTSSIPPSPCARKPSGRNGCRVWGPQGWTDGVKKVQGEGRPGRMRPVWGRPARKDGDRARAGGRMEEERQDGKVGAAEGGGEDEGVWREERWRRGRSGGGEVREGRL